jgi:hypothetical protein
VANADRGDLSQFSSIQQATSGRISVTSSPAVGGYAYHFQTRNGDRWQGDSGKVRSEALLQASGGYAPKEGQDYWHQLYMQVPRSLPTPKSDVDPVHLTQTRSIDNRESMAGFTLRRDGLTFDNNGLRLWTLSSVQRDRWYKMVWHTHWSTNAKAGYLELWVDDVKVAGPVYTKTLGSSGSYMKVGIYRTDQNQGTNDVYFDDIRVAGTRAAAEG